MRKLLIADDEKNIRLGLKAMIEREYPGAYSIRLAADGRQALEEHGREPADILLTDIRMPNMDGIALIRKLAELGNSPVLLILSGYDDFQYAKEAIKHKVKEYLLKPIVREDLFAALDKAEAELEEREALRGRLEETDKYREGMRLNTLRHVWSAPELEPEEVAALAGEAGLQDYASGFCVGILDTSGHQRNVIKVIEYLGVFGKDDPYICLEDKEGRVVVLAVREELLTGMVRELSAASGGLGTFFAGLSGKGEGLAQLRIKYEEARHALKYRVLLGRSNDALIRYDQLALRDCGYPIPAEKIGRLANMMGTDRDREMKTLLQEMFAADALARADIGYFEEVGRLLNESIFDQVFHTYGEASVDIIKMYKQAGSLYNFAHIQDYIHCVQNLLLGLNDFIRHLRSIHVDRKDMDRALEYIHANYAKDLNMAMVSNYVSLNYTYFSQAFKEFAGVSFVQYLKNVRIDKAKELLATTELKVMDISERSGFDNTKHFNRVFRETVGVTPLEFRQSVSEQTVKHKEEPR
ncbi:response regulator [Cohnella cellulosilytica]|uniref:Response regulator n=1 Tax=Cohnella cellulosilytica TaxID=986710 RepID=A0ABW2FIQ6_9BACL